MLFDNDRLSHWFAGALLTWAMMFLLWGFLVFHLLLKVPTARIATFTGICCAVQLAITPWLFSARATPQNPTGRIAQRAAAVTVLLSAITLLFFYYLRRSWPEDPDTLQFTSMALVRTTVLGIAGLIAVGFASRRHKNSTTVTRPNE